MRGRPEEVDAAQETDEERRIAERGERTSDIADEEDEKDDDVHVVEACRIGADASYCGCTPSRIQDYLATGPG
jgi:hypothetical protein